jgi:NADPH:quinone reductase-like Zn-dependent oxidoreductase
MRAFASDKFGEIAQLTLREVDKPTAGEGQVVVNVRAAAVNPADLKVLGHRDGGSFLHASKFPLILGYDYSGVVTEVGVDSKVYKVGDEVYGFLPYARSTTAGTFAEYVAVSEAAAGPKPKQLSHEQAAASATSAATALQGLHKAKIATGHTVLINGASGGVGSYAVQVAKTLGATVIATASGGKVDYVKGLGADRVYDYKTTPLREITERFDVVFDVASTSSFGTCLPLLKSGGCYVALLPGPGLFLGIARSWFTSKRCTFIVVKPIAADFAQLATWFDEGKLKPILDASYPLAELPTAIERQRIGDIRGKLAITIDAPAS